MKLIHIASYAASSSSRTLMHFSWPGSAVVVAAVVGIAIVLVVVVVVVVSLSHCISLWHYHLWRAVALEASDS